MYIKRLRKNVYALVLHHYSTVASKTAPSRKMLRSHHLFARESQLSEKKGREKKIYRSWIRVGLQLCQGV